ncbi:hypothetical protein SADUNF_Sadunf16G0296500 [Salix dunnii]|uniref:RING-CH-type domain-containing protein n=1 Tax=Salix dunnii TaxID=1413687 RepID=A0A835MHX1_9ROSI|nr:hypothetical protein SADUNF_Sadunf16G0296500 [Salix dunnii]
MQNDMSGRDSTTRAGAGDLDLAEVDLEKQDNNKALPQVGGNEILSENSGFPPVIAIAFSNDESTVAHVAASKEELPRVDSPRKESLSRTSSLHEQCRVCQQEKEEVLIDLGCKCKGGLAKAHRTCIDTWFSRIGSNKCEICQVVAVHVSPPESQPSVASKITMTLLEMWDLLLQNTQGLSCMLLITWIRDYNIQTTGFGELTLTLDHKITTGPLWVAFSILTGGLLLDVLISITLGVSALPVNIIIGVIVVLGLGTALRVALDFCIKWSFRRPVQREDANVNHGYHTAF